MKRFNQSAGIIAIAVAFTLSAGAAGEAGWHTLNGRKPQTVALGRHQLTPQERHLERIGAVNPNAKILPVHDGMQHISPVVDMQPSYVMAKTIENPRAHLYAVVSRTTSMTTADQAYLASIDPSTRVVQPRYYGSIYATSQGDSYVYQGAAYRDGKIYIPQLIQDAQGLNVYWNEVDLATGVQTNQYAFGADINCDAYSICYDSVNDLFYTLSFTDESDSHLGVVDPNQGFKYTYLAHLGTTQFFAGLAYNPLDNRIYAFDDDTNVYTINTRTNSAIRAGQLDIDYSLFAPNANAAITYSPMDQAFICIFRDNYTGTNRLVLIDPDDFEVTDAGALAGKQDIFISAIVCADDFAQAEAPELPDFMDIYFQDAELTGEISFKVPSLTYYGVEIPASTPVRALIKSGDIVIYDAQVKPGQEITINTTLPEGYHAIEFTCAIGDYVSPVRKQMVYVGYDNPMHPLKVHVEKNVVSWMSPGFQGQHDGYVDAWALTYDVYFDGVKQNDAPLTECRFEFNPPAEMTRMDVSVVASANGHSSEPAVLNCVIGQAFSLPFATMPDQATSSLFSIENSNNDAAKWFFTSKTGTSITGWASPMSYYNDANDWLFLPIIHFDDKQKMYELSFDASSLYSKSCVESLEIYIGTHPSSIGMNSEKLVFANSDLTVEPDGTHVVARFAVPEAGDYILGIHDCSKKSKGAQGMFVNNFLVQKLDASSAVPGNPAAVKVIPADFGAKSATLQITLPTTDLVESPLPASSTIKAMATCGAFRGYGEGHPGETVNIEVRVPVSGVNIFSLVLSNENGEGRIYTYSTYVGIDKPLHPNAIHHTVAEDNLSIQLLWTAPGNVGANGGYVDTDALLYDVYMRNGVAFSRVGTTDKLSATFQPTAPNQASYHITVGARNEAGTSEDSEVVQEVIGKPHELPILEEFNSTNFTVYPYTQKVENEFTGSRWENISDGSSLGIGNAIPVQGAVIAYSESGGAMPAKLTLPKFSTQGYDKLNVEVRYWDYIYTPTFYITARTYDNLNGITVAKINPKKNLTGQWVDFSCPLPAELLEKGWVELAFYTRLTGFQGEYLCIDSWQVAPEVDYDLKVRSITGPEQITVGETASFAVTVVNSGQLRNSGRIKIDLCNEAGGVIDSKSVSTASLNLNQEYTANVAFEIGGAFGDAKRLVVKAEVMATNGDQILNNNTRELKVDVKQSQLPVVKILRQTGYDSETGDFTGRIIAPSTSYGNFEDFEFYNPFDNTAYSGEGNLGKWKTVDLDRLYPLALGSGNLELKWEGYAMPCSWTVINPTQAGFPNDERLNAHSGGNCLMARASTDPADPDTPHQSSDWLISPEVKAGTPVTFWFNTIASDYTEYLEIWYSSEGTEVDPSAYPLDGATVCGDFVKLRSFHKVGGDVWEKVSFQLPDDAKYFAIVYTSFDSAAAMIDDIEFTPATLDKWEIDHYEVWKSVDRGEPQLVDEHLVGTTFKDNVAADQFAQYWVYVCVIDADGKVRKGPKSTILAVNPQNDGVAAVAALDGIAGAYGEIIAHGYQGKPISIYSVDGALLKHTVPASDTARIPMPKGLYIVSTQNGSAKVIVK